MLKRRFFPQLVSQGKYLDSILPEIKGSDVRRNAARSSRRQYRQAFGFLDKTFNLLEKFNVSVFGRAYTKEIGGPFDGRAVYTSSIQRICRTFSHYLQCNDDIGLVVADSRNKCMNAMVSHSIFTQKYQSTGDALPQLVELPTFGHSENHAGIQLADLVVSAVLFPIMIETYCRGYVTNVHVRAGYTRLKSRYKARLRDLQYRYQDETGWWRGGIVVSDPATKRSGAELFR
jgi:Protein of unknown function (DUF3800)